MKTIWKTPLEIKDEQIVNLPLGSQILSVQNQAGRLTMWFLCDEVAPPRAVEIRIVGTGHPFEDADSCRHLGTVQMGDGFMVWHVFERVHP